MNKKNRLIWLALLGCIFIIPIAYGYLNDKNWGVLAPRGSIAVEQKELLIITLALGMLVIIPVYIMLFAFAWRYRETNTKAKYSPQLKGNVLAEFIWWAVPLAIISVLSVITWNTSHSLDPHKEIQNGKEPIKVQVIALQWKWLFLYPEQQVASLNQLYVPVGHPIKFEITADAPMNSFWIPQLGSQIYAMPGMATSLNLVADKSGTYDGLSANLSGKGFADMRFKVHAQNMSDFNSWVDNVKSTDKNLSSTEYDILAKPGISKAPVVYSTVEKHLYHRVLLKYTNGERH